METAIKSQPINQIVISQEPAIKTRNEKFDNWFSKSGGMVLRSFILMTGSAGTGKTTLAINIMNWMAQTKTSLYSREMRKDDVKSQTSNIKFNHNNAYLADAKTHPHFNDYMQELTILKPKIVIIDSLQVIASEDFSEMTEDKACEHILNQLRNWVADNDAVLILIGHSNKNGEYKGVSTIRHLVDCHLELTLNKKTGDRKMQLSKNRKGIAGIPLFYSFGEEGIELLTEEERETKSGNRNFADYISTCTSTYVKTLDKSNPNYALFKRQYEQGIKNLELSSSTLLEFYGNVIKLVVELSATYKM